MKLIIDIPEDDYELVQKYIYPQRVFYELVHGIPIPDNATNEDVINTMFDRDMAYNITSYVKNYMLMGEWLNAPYQKGGK